MKITLLKPAGLTYQDELLSPDEEIRLVHLLEELHFYPVKMHGVESKRSVIHFGWKYSYTDRGISAAAPLPDGAEFVRTRAAAFAGVAPVALEQVLITRYPHGAGIGWHKDAATFGEPVVGVSLNAPCVLRFRRETEDGTETYLQLLNQRSVYVLAGEARYAWQHSISSTKSLRYSITFRVLKEPA